MADQSKEQKKTGRGGGDLREERLRAALRANLARRKAQARARSDKVTRQDEPAGSTDKGGEDG